MPGTPHSVLDHETLGERSAVMRARRADREKLVAAACYENRLIADMPYEHASVGKVIDRDAVREIGTRRVRLRGAHKASLSTGFAPHRGASAL